MFKKVLIALDFSGPAMELFNSLEDLRLLGARELLLVHVVRVEIGEQDGMHPLQKKFLDQVKDKQRELEKEGFSVSVEVPIGAAAEEIKRLAVEQKVDLILIGSIGEGSAVRELLLGSTTADVIRIAPVAVLVEKYSFDFASDLNKKLSELADRLGAFTQEVLISNISFVSREYAHLSGELLDLSERIKKKPLSAATKIQRIPIFKEGKATVLLPTDFSESSEHVMERIMELGSLLKEAILLNVIDRGETVEEVEKLEAEAEQYLKQWEEKFGAKGIKVRSMVLRGTPTSSRIIATAEREGVSLIALSRRGRGKIANLLIGSTAEQVVRRSPCPVLLFDRWGN